MGRGCEDLSHIARYRNRDSPSANSNARGCKGIITLGNDGQIYQSVNRSNNVHTWQKLCTASRPCLTKPYLYFDQDLQDYADDLVYLKRKDRGFTITLKPRDPLWWLF